MNEEELNIFVEKLYRVGREKGLKSIQIKEIIFDALFDAKNDITRKMLETEISEEYKDLNRYFILDRFRDGEYMLEEEYHELQVILKRCQKARELDHARYLMIDGQISEEEYDKLFKKYYDEANVASKEMFKAIELKKKMIKRVEDNLSYTF